MRVFQIIHRYGPYIPYFEEKYDIVASDPGFEEHRKILVSDRFYSPHILKPALEFDPDAFYTLWDYPLLQIKWAREKGWKEKNLKKILFAQIEDFKPDVFYCCSPIFFSPKDIQSIGGKRMIKLAWFASPEKNKIDFSVYHAKLTNYPGFLEQKNGYEFKAELFQPSTDPLMEQFAVNSDRPIDILFYGQYFPENFKARNEHIDKLVSLKINGKWNIKIALRYDLYYKSFLPEFFPARFRNSKFTRIFRRKEILFPDCSIRENTDKSLYGIDLYREIGKSKIVFNAAVDFSGKYKVNMRNFESLGCGAHMISDDGIYPDGLRKGKDFSVYTSFNDFIQKAEYFLSHQNESREIALNGFRAVNSKYSKAMQWDRFKAIVHAI